MEKNGRQCILQFIFRRIKYIDLTKIYLNFFEIRTRDKINFKLYIESLNGHNKLIFYRQ